MNGLFLQGGGAKGAFQAGVIYAMHEKALNFHIISGTSIGSVNGYFIYTNNIEEMKNFYTKTDLENIVENLKVTITIPNDYLINGLKRLKGINPYIKSFYINYVNVKNGVLKEIRINAANLPKENILTLIKYSSLLPYVCPDTIKSMPFNEVAKVFNSHDIEKTFAAKTKEGVYNNLNIDGGTLNNNFMEPFIDDPVDKLYLIVLHNNFQVPKYLLDKYGTHNLILIQRETLFKPNDSLNYNNKFLCDLFQEGYTAGKKIVE